MRVDGHARQISKISTAQACGLLTPSGAFSPLRASKPPAFAVLSCSICIGSADRFEAKSSYKPVYAKYVESHRYGIFDIN
ncbi:hypothetical protein OF66_2006 [Seleniivibrio woodruffii]|uniref:Uncharacterized protein n=1 Tax=Seleniivibrio woodruffii TaxID=1078050 RepID=A0A4V2PRZ7_9BACT|nr:hypothetical protein C8D98_1630 [Seleniivibrio woodruffii]TVZ36381.1 hypothetical protein OF66_2006 [Seleniivibrio woodruffii]